MSDLNTKHQAAGMVRRIVETLFLWPTLTVLLGTNDFITEAQDALFHGTRKKPRMRKTAYFRQSSSMPDLVRCNKHICIPDNTTVATRFDGSN